MHARRLTALFCIALMSAVPFATAEYDFEEIMGGFEDAPEVERSSEEMTVFSKEWHHKGNISLSSSYNFIDHYSDTGTDYEGWSKTRLRLNLEADKHLSKAWKLRLAGYVFYDPVYAQRDRSRFSDEVLEEMEFDADVQDMWIQGKLSKSVDIKLGRQVEIWGRSDNLRVVDILNPLDAMEPGLADIEDIRLPVTMAKLDVYFNAWNLSLLWLPEVRFSKYPPEGSDFNIYGSVASFNGVNMAALRINEAEEPDDVSNGSYAMALNGVFSGWDISFYAARIWQDAPVIGDFAITFDQGVLIPVIELDHGRYSSIGMAGSIVEKNWLFFYELAVLQDYQFNALRIPDNMLAVPELLVLEKNRFDVLFGAEYNGITDTSISVEIANRRVINYEDSMRDFSTLANQMETAIRYQRSFDHERWQLVALGILFGEKAQYGGIYRLQLSYEFNDSWDITGGLLRYRAGETEPLKRYEDNNRVFVDLKFSF